MYFRRHVPRHIQTGQREGSPRTPQQKSDSGPTGDAPPAARVFAQSFCQGLWAGKATRSAVAPSSSTRTVTGPEALHLSPGFLDRPVTSSPRGIAHSPGPCLARRPFARVFGNGGMWVRYCPDVWMAWPGALCSVRVELRAGVGIRQTLISSGMLCGLSHIHLKAGKGARNAKGRVGMERYVVNCVWKPSTPLVCPAGWCSGSTGLQGK